MKLGVFVSDWTPPELPELARGASFAAERAREKFDAMKRLWERGLMPEPLAQLSEEQLQQRLFKWPMVRHTLSLLAATPELIEKYVLYDSFLVNFAVSLSHGDAL